MDTAPGGFNDPWRTDPDKLAQMRNEVLRIAAVGERITALTAELQELRPQLPSEPLYERVGSAIFSLGQAAERAFHGLADSAENTTYLGNMAARRHMEEARREERSGQVERARHEAQRLG